MNVHARAVRDASAYLEEKPRNVAILGPASRTWRSDITQIDELVEFLGAFGAQLFVAGKLPFDKYVEEFAAVHGLDVVFTGPTELEERLQLEARDAFVLDGTELVVAFPRYEKKQKPIPESADPLVGLALEVGIPVLMVERDGGWTWITPENYLHTP